MRPLGTCLPGNTLVVENLNMRVLITCASQWVKVLETSHDALTGDLL